MREFSVPQLFNVKNLGPFFHDGSAATVRQAVEFYTSPAFNTSPAGQAIGGITMSAQTINDITAFLEELITTTFKLPRAPTDVDNDAKADLVWRHSTTGQVAVWLLDGATVRQARLVATLADQGWQIR